MEDIESHAKMIKEKGAILHPQMQTKSRASNRWVIALISRSLMIGIGWVIWHPLGVAIALLLTGSMRRFVVSNAAFWATKAMLIVGILWGILMAMVAYFGTSYATSSRIVSVFLYLSGFGSVTYIGYSPGPEAMPNKAGETAIVASFFYLVVLLPLVIFRGWPQ